MLFLFVGCGDNDDQKIQIEELQNKVLDLEDKLSATENELLALRAKHDALGKQVTSLSHGKRTSSFGTREKGASPSAEDVRQQSQRRSESKRKKVLIDRAKRTIYALLGEATDEEIAKHLNLGKVPPPDGGYWSLEGLKAFMLKHGLQRGIKK